jgi:hypothetical protein
LRFNRFLLLITLSSFAAGVVFAQNGTETVAEKEDPKDAAVKVNLSPAETEGVRIAESSIIVYSYFRGRNVLDQVRKTTVEIGKMTITSPGGSTSNAEYEQRILRGETAGDEKIRLDQKFPNAEYALVYNDGRVFGVIDNTVFEPRENATESFRHRIWHGLDALLRYRENGSKIELEKEESEMGVDFYVVNVTDKENRQTKFYVSKKSLRVMKLEYESEGVEYLRKFYDYNYAQSTLVPYRSVLWADGKQIEETKIATITFGQTVNEGLFKGDTP